MYKPLEVSECDNCGKVIAEPKELINTFRKGDGFGEIFQTHDFGQCCSHRGLWGMQLGYLANCLQHH